MAWEELCGLSEFGHQAAHLVSSEADKSHSICCYTKANPESPCETGECSSAVENLPSVHKALGSILSTTNKNLYAPWTSLPQDWSSSAFAWC